MSENSASSQVLRASVIVPAYNAEPTIDRCLHALTNQSLSRNSYELIVVDDDSSDLTPQRVKAYEGVLLHTQAHAGPAVARNAGVQRTSGKILLFTDADCAPAEDWIEQMLVPFADSNVAGVKGAYLTRQKELVARFVQLEYEDKYDRMAREDSIDFVDTYAAGYRRDVFVDSGGFDTFFPNASVEDQELSFRLARQGHRMVFAPKACVYHWGHARNLHTYWRRKFKIGFWKVAVHKRHPEKLVRDSHTPQIMKAQILLVGLGGLCLAGALLWPPLLWGLLLSAALFLVSTVPFSVKAWTTDPAVALISPGLLLVRALALGTGFVAGMAANRASGGPVGDDQTH